MAQPLFSIGIDLGTSSSSLAYASLTESGASKILAIPQWETSSTVMDSPIVPSFLYRPEEAVAAHIKGKEPNGGEWVIGRLAQRKASETPGRVVRSAKSWLCHHTADRSAPFLPWGSDTLALVDKISPVSASALVLQHLRAAWNARFAARGVNYQFDAQDITITVPASFDAAAQGLTLAAAQEAGFPDRTRLLEEPQAAFYWWLEQQDGVSDPWSALPDPKMGARHILVIDVGGGTSDFSLFELTRQDDNPEPKIKRVAVSEHILLGGDNIDLAIAHFLEPRFAKREEGISTGPQDHLAAGQWDHLVDRCRSLKEKVLGGKGAPDETFAISIPGRGSGLLAASLSAQLTRMELEDLLIGGFFPDCKATDRATRTISAIKEWGLPYAYDGAITRHLAEFLRDRQYVDAVLFNGGSLYPSRLRNRLREQIGKWQGGQSPQVLKNDQLELAVARGASYFGRQRYRRANRIEAGAARAVFFEAHRSEASIKDGNEKSQHPLICILPHGAPTEESFELVDPNLRLRVNKPVRFQIYTSTRHEANKVGDIEDRDAGEFHALPPLETIATVAQSASNIASIIPVMLITKVNELGLLQVSCLSLALDILQSWPLEFNLRPHESDQPPPVVAPREVYAAPEGLASAKARINNAFIQSPSERNKLTATRVFQSLEQILARSKGEWSGPLVRDLWSSLEGGQAGQALSVEHEEAWLILAGFLLRPGFGVAMDAARIDSLWHIRSDGPRFPGKRVRLQDHILWRRLAGGLSRERQEILIAGERNTIFQKKNVSPELVRMAGAFERLDHELKTELVEHFIDMAVDLMSQKKHCAPYLAALGLILNRTPLYAGPENVVSSDLVVQTYEALREFDWNNPEFGEIHDLFLRAARATDDRRLDLPKTLRHKIADKLENCGIAPVKAARLRNFMPIERAERLCLYGEAVPPGLILAD